MIIPFIRKCTFSLRFFRCGPSYFKSLSLIWLVWFVVHIEVERHVRLQNREVQDITFHDFNMGVNFILKHLMWTFNRGDIKVWQTTLRFLEMLFILKVVAKWCAKISSVTMCSVFAHHLVSPKIIVMVTLLIFAWQITKGILFHQKCSIEVVHSNLMTLRLNIHVE